MADEPPSPDDFALMARVRAGDEEAFTALVERHQQMVVGTIVRMLGTVEEAEDLAQTVFVRVWRNASRWEPSAKVTTWILTITRNLVFNEARRRSRARTVPLEDGVTEWPDHGVSSPAAEAEQAELQAAADAAIQALPEAARLAVILRRYEEKSYEEIAEVLGVTVPAVKSLLFRARQELRERLARYLG